MEKGEATPAVTSALTTAKPQPDLTRINLLNVGLMLMSCALAYLVPLELFLFSYAVLGPLHYLTQISWLQKRGFYTRGKYDYLFLVTLCLGILTQIVFRPLVPASFLVAIGFGGALVLSLSLKTTYKIALIFVVIIAAVLTRRLPLYSLLFSTFLPTLIHVYVFTGLFILYGALKSRSVTGYLSLCVFIGCGSIFFILNPPLLGITDSAYFRAGYEPFQRMTLYLSRLLGFSDVRNVSDIYRSSSGAALLRFIAFAYTYHYLNWFSKTSIIGWHEISRLRLVTIIALWIGAIGVYAADYRLGFAVLLFLSVGHVILEFPLNHQTIWGIVNELKKRVRGRARFHEDALTE